jgi:hypothetical protein
MSFSEALSVVSKEVCDAVSTQFDSLRNESENGILSDSCANGSGSVDFKLTTDSSGAAAASVESVEKVPRTYFEELLIKQGDKKRRI